MFAGRQLLFFGLILFSPQVFARTLYVDENTILPRPPYADWLTAAPSIQHALDLARPGDLILVTNGVYRTGGRAVCGHVTNRVSILLPVTVRSVGGPEKTIIKGFQLPGVTNADSSVRCAYLTNGSVLSGFTLLEGATRAVGNPRTDQAGGGVWCESASAIVSNCVFVGNRAHSLGGGAFQGTLKNCRLIGNSAMDQGGGAYDCALIDCVLTRNSAGNSGGGVFYSKMTNCTIAANAAKVSAGGVDSCTLYNCIVYFNSAPSRPNWVMSLLNYCCTQPLPKGGGNFTNAPVFLNLAAGNLHLAPNSPCINAGLNIRTHAESDADGNPRLTGEAVDIGAYEFRSPASVVSYHWLQQYGLPTDGSADFADPDRDGWNNLQEWRAGTNPTNAAPRQPALKPATDPSGPAE